MKNDTGRDAARVKIDILLTAFLLSVSSFFFIARYLIESYLPKVDLEPYIYRGWELSNPENEIQVYILGHIFVFVCTLIIYRIIYNLNNRSISIKIHASEILLRSTVGVVFVALYTVISIPLSLLWPVGLSLLLFILGLMLVLHVSGNNFIYKLAGIMKYTDMGLAALLLAASIFLIYISIGTEEFNKSNLIRIIHNEGFIYFQGFNSMHFLATVLMLCIFYGFYTFITSKAGKRRIPVIVRAVPDIAAILIIFFYISIIVPWDPGNWVGPTDYAPVISVINDILNGKSILVNTYSVYGLVMPYVLSIVFRFMHLTYNNFFLLNYGTTILGYVVLYVALRIWLKSRIVPFLWVLLVPLWHYIAQVTNILFFSQNTFFRFGTWVMLLGFFVIRDTYFRKNKTAQILELLLLGTAIFWAFDTGIYIFLAYISYTVIRSIVENPSPQKIVSSALKSLAQLTGMLVVFFLVINVFTYFRSGRFPDWAEYIFFTFAISGGFGLSKLPLPGPYILFIALHVSTGLYIVYKLFVSTEHRNVQDLPVLGFVTSYTILQFMYYIGQSASGNIHTISLPTFVLLAWVTDKAITQKTYVMAHLKFQERILAWSFMMLVLTSSAILLTISLLNLHVAWQSRGPITYYPGVDYLDGRVRESVNWLKNYVSTVPPYERKIAIIAHEDWLYHLETQSTNVLDSPMIYYFLLKSQHYGLCNQLLQRQPKDVFIQRDGNWGGYTDILRECALERYEFAENIGLLDRWTLKPL